MWTIHVVLWKEDGRREGRTGATASGRVSSSFLHLPPPLLFSRDIQLPNHTRMRYHMLTICDAAMKKRNLIRRLRWAWVTELAAGVLLVSKVPWREGSGRTT